MYISETTVRVRYSETDQMGYVYYGNYATFYEVARVECLRQLGLPYSTLEKQGVMMPVLESRSRFMAPAKYDDVLRIVTTIKDKPTSRIHFTYELYNEEGKNIHSGETSLVFVNMKSGRPQRCPEVMLQLLDTYFD